jgi:hypothetical protein
MANHSTVFVELDVHKDSIVAAYSVGFGEVVGLGVAARAGLIRLINSRRAATLILIWSRTNREAPGSETQLQEAAKHL